MADNYKLRKFFADNGPWRQGHDHSCGLEGAWEVSDTEYEDDYGGTWPRYHRYHTQAGWFVLDRQKDEVIHHPANCYLLYTPVNGGFHLDLPDEIDDLMDRLREYTGDHAVAVRMDSDTEYWIEGRTEESALKTFLGRFLRAARAEDRKRRSQVPVAIKDAILYGTPL